MPPSREQLRDRIHGVFSSDCTGTAVEDILPTFWAPSPDGITLSHILSITAASEGLEGLGNPVARGV